MLFGDRRQEHYRALARAIIERLAEKSLGGRLLEVGGSLRVHPGVKGNQGESHNFVGPPYFDTYPIPFVKIRRFQQSFKTQCILEKNQGCLYGRGFFHRAGRSCRWKQYLPGPFANVLELLVPQVLTLLGVTSPFFPGILLSRTPPQTPVKRIRFLKRTMSEKNGQGINP